MLRSLVAFVAGLLSVSLLVLPAQADVWMYKVQGTKVLPCQKRPERTIDDVWLKLEKASGKSWALDTSGRSPLLLGATLQAADRSGELVLYRTQHGCEFERAAIVAHLSGDATQQAAVKKQATPEARRAAIAPLDAKEKQAWVDLYAGCTDRTLAQVEGSPKGVVSKIVDNCACIASEGSKLSHAEFRERAQQIAAKCAGS